MADNIDAAFLALHARLDHAIAMAQRDLGRLSGSVETPAQRLEAFKDFVRDMGRTTDWLAANPLDQVQERQAQLYAAAAEALQQQMPQARDSIEGQDLEAWEPDPAFDHLYHPSGVAEIGTGSFAEAREEVLLEQHRAREYDTDNPTVLDRVEALEQRLQSVSQAQATPERSQGMER